MDLSEVFQKVGLALGLGLLVGLQRERAESLLAGIRTFPLITLLGTVAALLDQAGGGGWVVAAGALALAALIVVGDLAKMRVGSADLGITTEVAALLMYAVGAYLVVGPAPVAIALGGGTALLLYWKEPLHGFVSRIGPQDLKAIMQFVLVSLVILPVLPDQAFGPFQVFNPQRLWLMVVLIVGLSLAGYLVSKLFPAEVATGLAGVLGGLVSSTATTVSYARRSAAEPGTAAAAAAVIMIASTVSNVRVLAELAVVTPDHFAGMLPPLGMLLGWKVVLALSAYQLLRSHPVTPVAQSNPAQLSSALTFGAIYAVVLFLVALARHHGGAAGLYVVAALSGLTDLDAITLSAGQMAQDGSITPGTGWRMVVVGSLANLLFKGGVVAVLGSAGLRWRVVLLFALAAAGGLALLWLCPAA